MVSRCVREQKGCEPAIGQEKKFVLGSVEGGRLGFGNSHNGGRGL